MQLLPSPCMGFTLSPLKVYKMILLACSLVSFYWLGFACRRVFYNGMFAHQSFTPFPRKIWQIQHYAPEEKPVFVDDYREQWIRANPGYRYECLTGETEEVFVRHVFRNDEDIRRTYTALKDDPILRADYLRYLVLLAEGGVYTDVDTRPLQSIESWVPEEYLGQANVVLGVEIDKNQGQLWRGVPWTVQMSQFTIMTKANHPMMHRVVDSVRENLERFLEQHGTETLPQIFFDDVIGLTGPRVFTSAVFHYLSEQTGSNITGREVSGLHEPVLIADVLIFPVNWFASGQLHSNSGTSEDRTALVAHTWMSSWVPAHPHQAADNSYIS